MPVSQQVISLLQYLLPGFLAAWIFYGLTSYAKPSNFERVIQALIFTLFIQGLVFPFRLYFPQQGWVENILPFGVAVLLGIVFAIFVNNDWLHELLRRSRFTTQTSYQSEWLQSFEGYRVGYIVLHLKDGRRLIGWPEIWPANPDKGHILLENAAWVQGEGDSDAKVVELENVRGILVDASRVHMVEFISRYPEKSS